MDISRRCTSGRRGVHWLQSRAALLATLLPDPGTPQGRKELCEKIGGKLTTETDKEGRVKEITEWWRSAVET